MESIFAVMSEESFVENIIVAESKNVAESITGKPCIEITEDTPGGIGDFWDGQAFAWVDRKSV